MRWALLAAALAPARGWAPSRPHHATGPAPRPRGAVNVAPRPRRATLRPAVDFRLAEDDAAPIALRCTKTGRTIDCFPGCFMRLEDEGEWYVVATPCDQPVAFAPSIDDDEDDDWVIIQDDDPRMDAVFAVAERAVTSGRYVLSLRLGVLMFSSIAFRVPSTNSRNAPFNKTAPSDENFFI